MNTAETKHLEALGARILSQANDLKRTPDALAHDLDRDPETIRRVIAGEADLETTRSVLFAMAETYPISLADLWLDRDDTNHGVKVMSAAASMGSSRVFDRADGAGDLVPYYEYRDTAMSCTAPYKPEWIQPLRVVDAADPDHPDIAYNNGHLMHQMTFFVGEVNFFWRVGGRNHSAEMVTGDSNYITPFVQHSFCSRNPRELGYIVAVTYAGSVYGSLDAFMRLGAEQLDDLAGDMRDPKLAFAARIARNLAAESLSAGELIGRLVDQGVDEQRASAISTGAIIPEGGDLETLASVLNVRPSDLMVSALAPEEEVVVRFMAETASRPFAGSNRSAYRITDLARTKHQPGLKGFEITVLGDEPQNSTLRHGLNEYVFNYGRAPVNLHWGTDHQAVLEQGGSAYIQPLVGHRFARPSGADEGHLVVIRVPGKLTEPVIDELATFPTENRGRIAGETKRWF
jgi:methylphosphonate synthase